MIVVSDTSPISNLILIGQLGILKELNVQYVLGYTPEEFAYSLRLIAEGEVDAASLVTARVGIDGVAQAFADLANPEQHTKIIVEPWR